EREQLDGAVSRVVLAEGGDADGEGPEEGGGAGVRPTGEAGGRAGDGCRTDAGPAEAGGRVRVRPGERVRPRGPGGAGGDVTGRRGPGEVLPRLPRPADGGVEGRHPAGGEGVPGPQAGGGRVVGAEGREGRRGGASGGREPPVLSGAKPHRTTEQGAHAG